MNHLPVVALRIESSTLEIHWRKLLSAVNCRIIANDELAFDASPVDIVVTDDRPRLDATVLQRPPAEIYGVIGIGAAPPAADVVFEDAPTERELQRVCDLLYEIVYLRRERAASQRKQQLLTEMADLDGLTRLANRRAWDAELAVRMKSVNDDDTTLCLALLDLDHFKEVNTLHGYTVADNILRQVGRTLQAGVRAGDFAARIGGDEFGVLLSNISADRAEAVVERIRTSIESQLQRSGPAVVTATAGLAVRRQNHDAETLFASADANLRQGKSAGRNRTVASP